MARSFEIDSMSGFGISHTAEKHPTAYVVKFYKGVCIYCEPEKYKELVKEEDSNQKGVT
jgi:hypothetical protein